MLTESEGPDRVPRTERMFGLKDLFTTINCMGGVAAICLCVEQRPFLAGIAMLLGYVFGDALDGPVARWLKTANEFGAEYDAIADHVAHCLAPAAIVYTVYRHAELGVSDAVAHGIALCLAVAIVVVCSIRSARNRIVIVEVDGIWAGLPRTIVGFLAAATANSAVLAGIPHGAWIGAALIPLWCALALSWMPFANHRPTTRGVFWFVRLAIAAYFATTLTTLVFAPRWVFDVFLAWLLGYLVASRAALTAAERAHYRLVVRTARGLVMR